MPVRQGDAGRVQDFEAFFAVRLDAVISFTRPIYDRTTRIRAVYPRFKTPDALHLAAAVESGCDVFLTNDHRLQQFTGITVEVA